MGSLLLACLPPRPLPDAPPSPAAFLVALHDTGHVIIDCCRPDVCTGQSVPPAPAGLLNPRPLTCRPWYHIALDFVIGLPPSTDTVQWWTASQSQLTSCPSPSSHQRQNSWSSFPSWVEYAHKSQISVVSGMSPFMAALRYQPPLFEYQEEEALVSSMKSNLCRCRRVWRQVHSTLTHS